MMEELGHTGEGKEDRGRLFLLSLLHFREAELNATREQLERYAQDIADIMGQGGAKLSAVVCAEGIGSLAAKLAEQSGHDEDYAAALGDACRAVYCRDALRELRWRRTASA